MKPAFSLWASFAGFNYGIHRCFIIGSNRFGGQWAHFGVGRVYRLSQDAWPWVEQALIRHFEVASYRSAPFGFAGGTKALGNLSGIEDSIV